MYKIKKDDIEGWTYSKYLVDTEEEATAVYNENGVYDTHKDRKYKSRELYGGKASTLDYYPYTKVEFEDKADIYIINTCTVTSMADKKSRQIIRQAKSHNENSIVVATGCYAEVSKAELEKVEELDIIVRKCR